MMPKIHYLVGKEDELESNRLNECKKEGFPLCLKASLFRIFNESSGQFLLERILRSIDLRKREHHPLTAREVWMIYDRIVCDFAIEIGTDMSQVIEFEALNEMESMNCLLCPLYQREVIRMRGR